MSPGIFQIQQAFHIPTSNEVSARAVTFRWFLHEIIITKRGSFHVKTATTTNRAPMPTTLSVAQSLQLLNHKW